MLSGNANNNNPSGLLAYLEEPNSQEILMEHKIHKIQYSEII